MAVYTEFDGGNFSDIAANHSLKSAIEHGTFLIASIPPVPGEVYIPIHEEWNEEIEETIGEMSTIVTTEMQNRTRWDTPTAGMRKDRYSAVLCGYYAAREVLNSIARPQVLATGFWV